MAEKNDNGIVKEIVNEVVKEVKEVNVFDDMNLNDNLLRGIYSYGFENPSPIQCKAIPVMNTKKDLIAQAQSGTGKTGAFSIGILKIPLFLPSICIIIVQSSSLRREISYSGQ